MSSDPIQTRFDALADAGYDATIDAEGYPHDGDHRLDDEELEQWLFNRSLREDKGWTD